MVRKTSSNTVFIWLIALFFISLANSGAATQMWEAKVHVRHDKREVRDDRQQYRLQLKTQFEINENWWLHGYAATGDRFNNSYNTVDENQTFAIRRIFGRYKKGDTRVEFGVIPTYKADVSSTGLSKYGWIKGARYTQHFASKHTFEWVAGELTLESANHALSLPHSLNYGEFEVSSDWNDWLSTELSLEHMTGDPFVRGEVRIKHDGKTNLIEYINKIGSDEFKVVVGQKGEVHLFNYPISYFFHYSYVDPELGPRAELTEDFLGTGNALSLENKGKILQSKAQWFTRVDWVDGNYRWLVGLSASFK